MDCVPETASENAICRMVSRVEVFDPDRKRQDREKFSMWKKERRPRQVTDGGAKTCLGTAVDDEIRNEMHIDRFCDDSTFPAGGGPTATFSMRASNCKSVRYIILHIKRHSGRRVDMRIGRYIHIRHCSSMYCSHRRSNGLRRLRHVTDTRTDCRHRSSQGKIRPLRQQCKWHLDIREEQRPLLKQELERYLWRIMQCFQEKFFKSRKKLGSSLPV